MFTAIQKQNTTTPLVQHRHDNTTYFLCFFSTIYSSATIHVRTCREASDLATVIF